MDSNKIFALEKLIKKVAIRLNNCDQPITNKELINLCRTYEENIKSVDPHFYHEITEAALNYLLKEEYLGFNSPQLDPLKFVKTVIKPKAGNLPTQTWRSQKQVLFQQFSTPLSIAFLLWHLVNCRDSDTILEPSAGTGNLIIWGRNKIYCNEIDPRRVDILRALGFAPFTFNAEYLNDFLKPDISPDCILMNPPFSSNGGRTKNNSSKFGFRHVESTLERLKKGGKFGIILGEAGGLDTKTGNDFWRKLSDRIEVKSIIKIDGHEYYKMGTSVDINLITGKKLMEPRQDDWNQKLNKIINISVKTVEEAFVKVSQLDLRLDH